MRFVRSKDEEPTDDVDATAHASVVKEVTPSLMDTLKNGRERSRRRRRGTSQGQSELQLLTKLHTHVRPHQVQLRLYVGRFSGRRAGEHEQRVRAWAAEQQVGTGPIEVVGVKEVVGIVREAAGDTQYRDSAVLATLKALQEAGHLHQLDEEANGAKGIDRPVS